METLWSFRTEVNHKIRCNPSVVVGDSPPFFVKQTKKLSLKCLDCAKLTEKGAGKLGIL